MQGSSGPDNIQRSFEKKLQSNGIPTKVSQQGRIRSLYHSSMPEADEGYKCSCCGETYLSSTSAKMHVIRSKKCRSPEGIFPKVIPYKITTSRSDRRVGGRESIHDPSNHSDEHHDVSNDRLENDSTAEHNCDAHLLDPATGNVLYEYIVFQYSTACVTFLCYKKMGYILVLQRSFYIMCYKDASEVVSNDQNDLPAEQNIQHYVSHYYNVEFIYHIEHIC